MRFFVPSRLGDNDIKSALKAMADLCKQLDTLSEPLKVAFTGHRELVLGISLVACRQPRCKVHRKVQCA